MTKKQELKRVAIFTFLGAIGFSIGAIAFGAIRIPLWAIGIMSSGSLPSILGFPVMGALGGAALGFVLRSWQKALVLASVGAIAFFVGWAGGLITGFMLTLAGVIIGGDIANSIFYGMIPGAIGGATLGLVFLDFRKAIMLALAGALGFGIGMLIMCYSSLDPWVGWAKPGNLKPWLGWVLWGAIGGVFLGAALGYLEKRKADRGRG